MRQNKTAYKLATSQDLSVLNQVYGLNLIESVKVFTKKSLLSFRHLDPNDSNSETEFKLNDMQIHMPDDTKKTLSSDSELVLELGNASTNRFALVDGQLYLLNIAEYSVSESLTDFLAKNRSQHRSSNQTSVLFQVTKDESNNNQEVEMSLGRAKTQRNATNAERLYLDPVNSDTMFPIALIVVLFILPFVLPDIMSFLAWIGIYCAILFVGFVLWTHENKNPLGHFKISKFIGYFYSIEEVGSKLFLLLADPYGKGTQKLEIPITWKDKVTPYLKTSDVLFEAHLERGKILSIGNTLTIEDELKNPPATDNKNKLWIAAIFGTCALSLLININYSRAIMSINMLTNTTTINADSADDWDSVNYIGQRIQTTNINKSCLMVDTPNSPTKWKKTCDEFYILDQAPTIDLLALATPNLEHIKEINSALQFPIISDKAYNMLRIKFLMDEHELSNRIQGQRLKDQDELLIYNEEILHNWGNWITDNNIYDERLREKIIDYWLEINPDCKTSTSENSCWNEIMSYVKDPDEKPVNELYSILMSQLHITDHASIATFNSHRVRYLDLQLKDILNTWQKNIKESLNQIENKTLVHLIETEVETDPWRNNTQENKDWSTLIYYLFEANYTTDNHQELIINGIASLEKMQKKDINYGVVSAIDFTDNGKQITIDLNMNNQYFYTTLTQIFIMLLAMFVALHSLYKYKVVERKRLDTENRPFYDR